MLDATPAAGQREAHAALAAALPPGDPAALWHRAEATVGTDPDLAARLAPWPTRTGTGWGTQPPRSPWSGPRCSPSTRPGRDLAGPRHARRVPGRRRRTRARAGRSGPVLGAPDTARGEVLFTLGMLEQYAGSVPLAVDHLAFASDLLRGVQQVRALTELAISQFRLNDLAGMSACAQRIERAADPSDPEQALLAAFAVGTTLVLSGDFEAGAARLAQVRRLADTPALRHEARPLLLMALAAGFTGQVREAVDVGAARVVEVRRRGALGVLVPTLAILAGGRAWLGDHVGAFADAGEAADLAEHLGYAADASVAVEMLAWQQAARGLHDDARASLSRARVLTDRAGTTAAAAHQALTAAFCALCRGDLAGVVAELEPRLAADGGVGASGEPLGVAPLLVEAYVGLGRLEDARALTARYGVVTPAESPPLSTALLGRCRLLTAEDDDEAERAFAAAMQAHEGRSGPVRGGPHPAAEGQPAAPGRPAGRRAGAAGGGQVGVRGHGPDLLGRAGRPGARGHRRHPTPPGRRRPAADLAGDPGRPARRAGPVQPRDRRCPVPQPEDRRAAPRLSVPEARLPLPRRAGSRVRACSGALTLLAPAPECGQDRRHGTETENALNRLWRRGFSDP